MLFKQGDTRRYNQSKSCSSLKKTKFGSKREQSTQVDDKLINAADGTTSSMSAGIKRSRAKFDHLDATGEVWVVVKNNGLSIDQRQLLNSSCVYVNSVPLAMYKAVTD